MIDHGQDSYTTYYDGKYTTVPPLEDAIRGILCRNKRNEERFEFQEIR